MSVLDVEAVRKAVQAVDVPSEAKALFLSDLSGTGGVLLSAALTDAQRKAANELRSASEAVAAADKELATCKEALAEAGKQAEETSVAADEAKAKVTTLNKAAKEADAEHKAAERDGSAQAKYWAQLREEHEKASAICDGSLKLLCEGGWVDEDIKAASVQAVESLLSDIGVEKALASAAPAALGTAPDLRKPFDTMVVEGVAECVAGKVNELKMKLDEDSTADRLAEAELLGLWAIAACSRDDAGKAGEAEVEASASNKRAHADEGIARKRLKTLTTRSTALATSKATCEEAADMIEEATAAVERLKAAPPPAAEEAPIAAAAEDEVEEAPMAAAAEDEVEEAPIAAAAEDEVEEAPMAAAVEDEVEEAPVAMEVEAS